MIDYMEDEDTALAMLVENWFCEDRAPGEAPCTYTNSHGLCLESNEYSVMHDLSMIWEDQAIAAAEWNAGL